MCFVVVFHKIRKIIVIVAKSQILKSITTRNYALHSGRMQWGQYHFCKQPYCQLVPSEIEVETYRFFIVADRCCCSSYCCFDVRFFKPIVLDWNKFKMWHTHAIVKKNVSQHATMDFHRIHKPNIVVTMHRLQRKIYQ